PSDQPRRPLHHRGMRRTRRQGDIMTTLHVQRARRWRIHALAAALAAAFSTAAVAGQCPADKVVPDGQGQKMVSTPARDVVDVVRASTDLGTQKIAAPGYLFRL